MKNLKKALSDHDYLSMYELLGENLYRVFLSFSQVQKKEIKNELGVTFNKTIFLENLKRKLKYYSFLVGSATLISNSCINMYLSHSLNSVSSYEETFEEREDLQQVKKQYEEDIINYANSIRGLQLNDTQIFVKVMYDMWENIYGYRLSSHPLDSKRLWRYSLYVENYGVCRQFADDYAARLNAINAAYNAKVINVFASSAEPNQIKRNIIDSDIDSNLGISPVIKQFLNQKIGNHLVVMASVPGKDYTLILDPTNLSISLFENGKIYNLNDDTVSSSMMNLTNVKYYDNDAAFFTYVQRYLKSFHNNTTPVALLEEYGLETQNSYIEAFDNSLESCYRTFSSDLLSQVFVDETCSYETWTLDGTMYIRPVDIYVSSSVLVTPSFYHIVNLRIKNDPSIHSLKVYGFAEDIDLEKIAFPIEKIHFFRLNYCAKTAVLKKCAKQFFEH